MKREQRYYSNIGIPKAEYLHIFYIQIRSKTVSDISAYKKNIIT
jgi:hypothetical protein